MALSYVWGDPEPQKTILIHDKTKLVTSNLYDALLELRNPGHPILLWVDAVCINQEDIQERNQQVRLMAAIYSQVWHVVCWLGRLTEGIHGTEDSARILGSLPPIFQIKGQDGTPLWKSPWFIGRLNHHLHILCSLPYWHRVWITQEVVLSRNATFLWGSIQINLAAFEKLLEIKNRLIPANWYFSFSVRGSTLMYANFTQILEMRSCRPTLQSALLATRHRKATDPRDYVYGVLSLAQVYHDIIPDHTKTVETVYLEVFKVILGQESNLDILSACGRGWMQTREARSSARQNAWPTWLPDWSHESLKGFKPTIIPDESSGIEDNFKSILLDCQEYAPVELSAGGSSEKSAHILPGDQQLNVHGIEFDAVDFKIDAPNPDTWADEVKKLWDLDSLPLRSVYDNLHVLRNACMRTKRYGHRNSIMASPESGSTPSFADSGYVIDEAVPPVTTSNTQPLEPFDDDEKLESDRDRMQPGIFDNTNRFLLGEADGSYFVTRKGYVGRSPMPVEVGDKVCIFFGAKVPFLLRQVESTDSFNLVGEAYIHGIMKGAAMNAMRCESRDFILV